MRLDRGDVAMEDIIVPFSESITVVEQRTLLETTSFVKGFLTKEEFSAVMGIYLSAINRLEKEGEIHEVNTT